MKKIKTILVTAILCAVVSTVFSACSNDDDNKPDSTSSGYMHVKIGDNGKTSNGSIFSAIDNKIFYLDYVEYTVEKGHLVVTGYDETGFKGTAHIVSSITYKENTYEVLGIADRAFRECDNIASVTIFNGVKSIGNMAFYNCSSLTSVIIGSDVKSMGGYAFAVCSNLTSVTISNGVTSIGNSAFSDCSSLTSITIPNGVTSIGNFAFSDCSSLTSIIIPNGVTSIGGGAFYRCNGLTSITIPENVTSIGNMAFWECSSLTSVYSRIEKPFYIEYDVFRRIADSATLYVPKGTKEAYESTEGWTTNFSHIVEQ